MKDWRGVIIELGILAAMITAMVLDRTLVASVIPVLAAWGGQVITRAKIDALVGVSIAPPPMMPGSGSGGGGGQRLSLRVPVYKAPPTIPDIEPHSQKGNGKTL